MEFAMMRRILVVEDDEKQARYIGMLLRQFQYSVDCATCGSAALDLVDSEDYAVMVLDWQLPDCDGPALVQRIRDSGVKSPILMLTGRSSVPDRVLALESGADDFLIKPYDVREFVARVAALVRRGRRATSDCLRAGEIQVDLKSLEVSVSGTKVSLTHLELRLLVFLLEKGRAVARRSEILAAVWDTHTDVGSNVLDVHVAHLRQKLGTAGRRIRTVRGIGYRLADCGQRDDKR